MDTSRAVINIIDNSSTFEQEITGVTGFTVVKAPKGPVTPVLINKGGAADLKDIFGVSSKEYPELFEAETFNREYDLYVSAPYTKATIPVAYLTTNGVLLRAGDNVEYKESIEKYALNEEDNLPVIDGISSITGSVEGLKDLKHPEYYGGAALKSSERIPTLKDIALDSDDPDTKTAGLLISTGLTKEGFEGEKSIRIISGETSYDYDISNFELKAGEATKGYLVYLDNDTYKKVEDTQENSDDTEPAGDTGDDSSTAGGTEDAGGVPEDAKICIFLTDLYSEETPSGIKNLNDPEVRESLKIYWKESIASDDIYAAIFPKFPSERALHISFTAFNPIDFSSDSYRNWNTLKMSVYEDGAFRNSAKPVYVEGALDDTYRASDGSFLGFSGLNNSYANQNLVCVYPLKTFTVDSSINTKISGFGNVTLSGGTREFGEDDKALHELGWTKALESEFSDVDIFFDSQVHDTEDTNKIPEGFKSLATSDVSAHELAGYIFNLTISPTVLETSNNKLGLGRNYWNICNIGIIEDRINGTKFESALTGAKSLMQARIIETKMGGVAPMWENTSVSGVGLGGQLDMITVSRLKYKYSKTQLDKLDRLNYNPVVNDRQYGIMVVGQKTCKSGSTTDWSYIGHASAFLNFLKEVRANVMIPQIGKPNNPYYRTLRKDQVDAYLAQRLNGSNRIWAEAECDTSTADGVNDVHALKARKFVINVRVKVDVFSEIVELNFTNEGQDTIINMAQ